MIIVRMEVVFFVFGVLLMLPLSALGVETGSSDDAIVITTDDALELALANNLDIHAGLAALETVRAQVASADNRWNPRLTGTYSYTRLAEEPTMTFPGDEEPEEYVVGDVNNFMLGFRFIWPVYTGGEREATVRMSELAVEGLEAQQEVLEDITGVLAQHYCLCLREARGQVAARKKSFEYITGLLNTSEAFYEQGLIPKNDLLRVRVEHTNLKQAHDAAIDHERYAQDELNAFIGFDFGTHVKVKVLGYEPFFFAVDLGPFFELALNQRPEVKALNLQYDVLEEQRKMAKSGRSPDVNLVVAFERAGDSLFLDETSNTISGTIQVSYDLYDGGDISDQLTELDKRMLELDIAKRRLEQSIYLELEQAYLSVKRAYGAIKAAEVAIVQAEENLRITRRRFEENLVVTNDVIEAEALLLAANLTYTSSRYNYYRAAAYVGKAVGVADMNYYLELKDTFGLDDGNENDE